MQEAVTPAILELLSWIAERPRTYGEAMQAWRSNCPRESPWEDALLRGFISVGDNGASMDVSAVILTAQGRAALGSSRSPRR
jgi:hypothetical protein